MQRDDFRSDKPVSRGQWRAIATAALRLSGETVPENRMDATELLVRLRRTQDGTASRTAARPGGSR